MFKDVVRPWQGGKSRFPESRGQGVPPADRENDPWVPDERVSHVPKRRQTKQGFGSPQPATDLAASG